MSAARPQVSTAPRFDADFFARIVDGLEQQRVGEGEHAWTVHVMGVHDAGGELWIQVAADPEGRDGVVLRLSPHASADQALAALRAVAPSDAQYPRVVAVMKTVARVER